MDLGPLSVSADHLKHLSTTWSPWLDICHFLLSTIAVREEMGLPFSRSNPLATWLATMSACFAGSLLANPLLGKPILGALSNEYSLLLASLVWWSLFYSPGDVVYQAVKNKLIYVPVCALKEVYRAEKILGGINDARKIYPEHETIMVMIGVIKGNGSGFIKPITRLLCGHWSPGSSEILKISVTSKGCILAALLMVADLSGLMPRPVAGDLLYLCIVSVLVVVKVTSLVSQPLDPYQPLDRAVYLLTGGLWN